MVAETRERQGNQMPREAAAPQGLMQNASAALEQSTEIIKEYPLVSLTVMFGVGVGIGALIGSSFGSTPTFWEKQETTAQRLGRQLCDALHIKV